MPCIVDKSEKTVTESLWPSGHRNCNTLALDTYIVRSTKYARQGKGLAGRDSLTSSTKDIGLPLRQLEKQQLQPGGYELQGQIPR